MAIGPFSAAGATGFLAESIKSAIQLPWLHHRGFSRAWSFNLAWPELPRKAEYDGGGKTDKRERSGSIRKPVVVLAVIPKDLEPQDRNKRRRQQSQKIWPRLCSIAKPRKGGCKRRC